MAPQDNQIDGKDLGWEKIREGKERTSCFFFFKMTFQPYQAKNLDATKLLEEKCCFNLLLNV